MDAVLGLSVTPSTVGLVLVEGPEGDGVTMDRDAFEVDSRADDGGVHTSERAAAAVLRTEALAAAQGHRLCSIGVTWSDDAHAEASLLLKSLTDSGFVNVMPVRMPEATEALARGIAAAVGYPTTAVCVVEPEAIMAFVVHTENATMQTAVTHDIDTDERLVRWLSAVFAKADWQPDALVVVGSAGDLDTALLNEVLAVPVFTPAEAELALAHGAVMASSTGAGAKVQDAEPRDHARTRRLAPLVAMAMLAGGVVTFVVSLSLAIGLHLTSQGDDHPTQSQPAAVDHPAAVQHAPSAIEAPVAVPQAEAPAPDVPAEDPSVP